MITGRRIPRCSDTHLFGARAVVSPRGEHACRASASVSRGQPFPSPSAPFTSPPQTFLAQMASSRLVASSSKSSRAFGRVIRRSRRTDEETRALHRAFFERIREHKKLESLLDLSKVTTREILSEGGGAILKHYDNSPHKALREVFPEIDWNPLSFSKVPHNFWDSPLNQKGYLEGISTTLRFTSLEGWYKASQTALAKQFPHLSSLLSKFDGSLRKALESLYSDHKWDPNRFLHIAGGHWDSDENRIKFLKGLAQSKGFDVNNVDAWYKLKQKDFVQANGRGLLARFEDSHSKLLMSVLNHFPWDVARFDTVPRGHWMSESNQRSKIDEIGKSLGIRSLSDWYSISLDKVLEVNGSAGLMAIHNNSLSEALKAAYPEHEWKGYRFAVTSHGLHENWAEVEMFIKDAEKKLRIKSHEDWYRVSQDLLWRLGGGQLIAKNGGLYTVLKKVFSEVIWDQDRLTYEKFTKKSSQRWLYIVLCDLFDETKTTLLENHSHATLKYPVSNQPIELDIFLPDLKLGFEYQGKQHYQDTMVFGLAELYKSRDIEKNRICTEAGLTLIEVPYWWDGNHETLAGTILHHRPDLSNLIAHQYVRHGASIPQSVAAAFDSFARKRRRKKIVFE